MEYILEISGNYFLLIIFKWKIILLNQINCLPVPTSRDLSPKYLVFNLNGIKWNQMACLLASSDLSPK
jgi:hypothetical protein